MEQSADRKEVLVRHLQRALTWRLAAGPALRYSMLWLLAWATLSLILRAGFEIPVIWLLWGGVGLVVALAWAWREARARRPDASALRALLDDYNDAGGLLLAGAETSLGAWQPRLGDVQAPRLRWRGAARQWGQLVGAVIFLAVCLWVPVTSVGSTRGALQVDRQVDELSERIEALEEEEVLEPERAEALREELEQLQQQADGEDPGTTWEALDHLDDMTQQAADEAAEAALAEGEKLASAEALAQALAEGMEAGSLDAQAMGEAMADLSNLLGAGQDNRTPRPTLPEELASALQQGELSAEQLRQLAQALSSDRQAMQQALQRLNEAGMIDAETLQQLQAMDGTASQDQQLSDFLEQELREQQARRQCEGGNCPLGEGGSCPNHGDSSSPGNSRPGQGGVSRGRGDAQMSWTEATAEGDERFQAIALPPGALNAARSQVIDVTLAAPSSNAGTAATASAGGVLAAGEGGGSAVTGEVLPRHRAAVKRYFEHGRSRGTAPPSVPDVP